MPAPFFDFTTAPQQLAQAINPWSWWASNANSPNGFINITTYKTNAPSVEQKIVAEAAGYGMQLGRITEALEAIIATLPQAKTKEHQHAIEDFKNMAASIREVKQKAALESISPNGIKGVIAALETLKTTDKAAYEKAASALRSAL